MVNIDSKSHGRGLLYEVQGFARGKIGKSKETYIKISGGRGWMMSGEAWERHSDESGRHMKTKASHLDRRHEAVPMYQ
jgi:hypothetical protein